MTGKMEARLPARRSNTHRWVWAGTLPVAARRDEAAHHRAPDPVAGGARIRRVLSRSAHALTLQEQGWQVANSKCQSGDAKQCELRDQLSGALKRKGCLFHEDGGWWKCSGGR